jgi:type IV pilus assembly protein PilV
VKHASHQRGVSLIEVLVAVLILSIGLMGVATLQLRTLRNNSSSLERGAAVAQAYAIVDAMRADRDNAIAGNFNITIDAAAVTGTTFAAVTLVEWRNSITAALGTGASGSVSCNGALCTIVVRWNDERATLGSATQTLTTEVQL